jgi:GH15 family glucan-1,4-alpha-glucosidase
MATLPTYPIGNTNIWDKYSNEYFYQMLVENLLKGHHKNLICGCTDVTNDNCHAEIKLWKHFKDGIGQILTYTAVDEKPNMELYMFGDETEEIKNVALFVTSKFNIHLFEFCTYDRDKYQVFLFDITLNKHICTFVPRDKQITSNYSNQVLMEYRKLFVQNSSNQNTASQVNAVPKTTPVFICKRCNMGFAYKHHLVNHLRKKIPCSMHNDNIEIDDYLAEFKIDKERPFSCKYCDKTYTTNTNRYRHQTKCLNNPKNLKESDNITEIPNPTSE